MTLTLTLDRVEVIPIHISGRDVPTHQITAKSGKLFVDVRTHTPEFQSTRSPGDDLKINGTCRSQGVRVAGADVQFADYLKLLGVTLNSSLSFDKHVIHVTRSCLYHIRALHHIRPLMTLDIQPKLWLLPSSALDWTTATVCFIECRKRT